MKKWVLPFLERETRKKAREMGIPKEEVEELANFRYEHGKNAEQALDDLLDYLNYEFGTWGLLGPNWRFREVFASVLGDLPKEAFDKIRRQRNVAYILPMDDYAETKIVNMPKARHKEEQLKIVTFPRWYINKPDKSLRGSIAHELAHIYLGHDFRQSVQKHPKTRDEQEAEADRTARKWGFEKEIDELEKDRAEVQEQHRKTKPKEKERKADSIA